MEELRKGKVDSLQIASEDETVSVCYRYLLAVRDNAARRNLRLLAQAIAGLAKRDRLFADEFNKYAEIFSRLSRDEILVLARLYAFSQKAKEETEDIEAARSNAWKAMIRELVPAQFSSEDYVRAVCSQAVGHGLMIAHSAWGGLAYDLSPIMGEVAALVDFERALSEEELSNPEVS